MDNYRMASATPVDVDALFQQFRLDPTYGFVTHADRAHKRLPKAFSLWDHLGTDLPALSTSGKLRVLVDKVPELSCAIRRRWPSWM